MRNMRKMVMCAMCALVVALGANATYAYLTDRESATNTFTVGNIDITLTETGSGQDADDDDNTNSYKMVPGQEIAKDPVVTVRGGSEDCWLFVKVDKSGGVVTVKEGDENVTKSFDDFVAYEPAQGWMLLKNDDNSSVYYRAVDADDVDQPFNVLSAGTDPAMADGHVCVLPDVTKDMMDALVTNGEGSLPKLAFTAYAVQKAGFETPELAWAEADE